MNRKNFTLLFLPVSLVLGFVLAGGCVASGKVTSETSTRIIADVTSQEAFTLIQNNQNNPDFVILDVRTSEEFADGHIEKAIKIDFYLETFRDELDDLDKSKTYLIYCRSGNRSGRALVMMEELGFQEAYNISDGIIGWEAVGLPLTKWFFLIDPPLL